MAELSYEVDRLAHATITLKGPIVAGDAQRFEDLAWAVCEKRGGSGS